MGFFKKFAADMLDNAASDYRRFSHKKELTPEQRERALEASNRLRNLGDSLRDDDD